MPRQRSLVTVIRDLVQQEVRFAIQSLLGSISTGKTTPKTGRGRKRRGKWRPGGPGRPPKAEEAQTQLATRIPKELHYRLKLHCVTHDIAVQDFVTQAVEEKLGRKTRPKKGTA